jgi:hypothetical protein
MGDSDKGIVALLTGGLLYAILRLGDELAVVSDEISRTILRSLEDYLFLIPGLDDIAQEIAEIELSLETLVLTLLAIFLALAILDYISNEL